MNVLLTRVLVFTLLVAVGAGQGRAADSAAAAAPQQPPKPKTLETLIEEITKLVQASKTPGLSLAIVTKDKVLFVGGIGLADVAKRTPVTADTLFRTGSTSKAFTALAALKLQAQGRLDLNATLASLAPDLDFKNPWEATDPVRIVHLLEHTSGFEEVHLRGWIPDPQANNLRAALARLIRAPRAGARARVLPIPAWAHLWWPM